MAGRSALLLLAGVSAAAAGCTAEEIRGPQTVRTLVYDSTLGRFQLADRILDTLEELTTLRGATTEMRTGARLVLDDRELQGAQTCAQFADSFVEDPGRRPSLSFIDDDGVYVAEDFDGLVMVSTYYNFELAREFFISAGVPPGDLDGTTTFYEPTLINYNAAGSRSFGFDNAAFVTCISSFLVYAGERLQDIPLGANPGVAAHEYSHLVFDRVMFGPQGDATDPPVDLRSALLLAALNEGLADFFGAAVLGDPNFAARSLTLSDSRERDLAPGRNWSTGIEELVLSAKNPNPYALGTVWGSFFWDLGVALEGQTVAAAALALEALRVLQADGDLDTFDTEAMLDATFVAARALDDGGRTLGAVCAAVDKRFADFRLLTSPCPG